MDEKIKVKRAPKRGIYNREEIDEILDRNNICHLGFVHEGFPVVIPTVYGRSGDCIYIHGSTASRMMKNLAQGFECCATVTKVNDLVLAKSAFHHSMNYESVVIFGKAVPVEGEGEKVEALKVITNHIIRGRWDEVRAPNKKELKGTAVLKLSLEQASAKRRTGMPIDDKADEKLPIWSGLLPVNQGYGTAISVDPAQEVSASVTRLSVCS